MRERQGLGKKIRRGSLPSINYTCRFRGRSNGLRGKKVTNQLIKVEINGVKKDVPSGLKVRGLLQFLKVDEERVAVELNRSIIRKAAWDECLVEDGAQVEVVMFVGGGIR